MWSTTQIGSILLLMVLVCCVHVVSSYYASISSYDQNNYDRKYYPPQSSPYRKKAYRNQQTKHNFISEQFVNGYNRKMRFENMNDMYSPDSPPTYKGPFRAAVKRKHRLDFINVDLPYEEPIEPHIIEIEGSIIPIVLHFKSASSPIQIQQFHQPSVASEVQETKSEDEPHVLRHQVTKPIIQEVREIITPYRRIVQEVQPVQEEIQTVVARAVDGEHKNVSDGYQMDTNRSEETHQTGRSSKKKSDRSY